MRRFRHLPFLHVCAAAGNVAVAGDHLSSIEPPPPARPAPRRTAPRPRAGRSPRAVSAGNRAGGRAPYSLSTSSGWVRVTPAEGERDSGLWGEAGVIQDDSLLQYPRGSELEVHPGPMTEMGLHRREARRSYAAPRRRLQPVVAGMPLAPDDTKTSISSRKSARADPSQPATAPSST
jgi:hypothetical protein